LRFGPTSVRLTSVLARNLRRPELRSDLRISHQMMAGEESYVIKAPETDNYARYGPFEFQVLQLCDGTRTAAQVAQALSEKDPDSALSEEEVAEFLDSVDPALWNRGAGERNLAILEKIRDERNQRVNRASILYIYFSAWDPNRTLERIHPYFKWMFTRGFVVFSLAMFLITAVIIVADWARIQQDTIQFYNFADKTAYDLWIFWVILFFVSGVHEFGHGLTCKHFGGEVHQMGFMLIFFTPSFYTDCTDMHLFDRTSKRLWTIFAGLWVELVVCGGATLVWYFSPAGSFVGDLAYKTLLLTGVSGVFFNLNPLMKFDGYYALAQYLEIDNLREDAFDYLKVWARRTILRQDVELPPVSRRKRRIYLVFGIAASFYSVFVLTIVSLFIKNVFTSNFGDWGYPLTIFAIYLLLRRRIRSLFQGLRSAWQGNKEKLMAWRMNRLQLVGALGLVALITAVPTSTTVATDFLLEPGRRAEVRAPVAGWIAEVRVQEGDRVDAGTPLAVLRNPELETRATMLEQELTLGARRLVAAQSQRDSAEIHRQTGERQRLLAALAEIRTKRDALVLRSPIHGEVTTPMLPQRVGEYLPDGGEFARVVDRNVVRARILVRDWELEQVREQGRVKLLVHAHPTRTFEGTVEKILPAAAADRPVSAPPRLERFGQEQTNYFALVVSFPNSDGLLTEGMTGVAKIYGQRYPLAWHGARSFWRWFRSQVW
jgi:putative peptide zinc metalloprotease protein